MLRKLVSIQTIDKLEPIEGRDRILKATVLGWTTIVRVGEFNVGDKCCWFEIDSLLPDGPDYFEFMRNRKFRVRTLRMGGVLSQGLALPLSTFPNFKDLPVDTEVTELLGVIKYEPLLRDGGAKMGQALGSFPHFINKTDEIRLQSKPNLLQELKFAGPFYISIKVDGTSSTYCYDNDEFFACSRNWKKREDETNIYWKMARKYKLPEVLANNKFLAIQGEIAGPGVQQNRLRLIENDLFVFDVYDINKRSYLSLNEMVEFCNANGLRTVPIESVVLDEEVCSLDVWLKRAEGLYEGTDKQREGIVVRPTNTTYSPTLNGRLSFKVINNLYLLSGGE